MPTLVSSGFTCYATALAPAPASDEIVLISQTFKGHSEKHTSVFKQQQQHCNKTFQKKHSEESYIILGIHHCVKDKTSDYLTPPTLYLSIFMTKSHTV